MLVNACMTSYILWRYSSTVIFICPVFFVAFLLIFRSSEFTVFTQINSYAIHNFAQILSCFLFTIRKHATCARVVIAQDIG